MNPAMLLTSDHAGNMALCVGNSRASTPGSEFKLHCAAMMVPGEGRQQNVRKRISVECSTSNGETQIRRKKAWLYKPGRSPDRSELIRTYACHQLVCRSASDVSSPAPGRFRFSSSTRVGEYVVRAPSVRRRICITGLHLLRRS